MSMPNSDFSLSIYSITINHSKVDYIEYKIKTRLENNIEPRLAV